MRVRWFTSSDCPCDGFALLQSYDQGLPFGNPVPLSTNVFNSFIIEIMIVVLNGKTASLGHMLIVVAVGRDFAFLGNCLVRLHQRVELGDFLACL